MVLAVGLPLAAWAVGEATRRPHRLAAAALFLLLLASIVASGSRGALVSGFGGLLAYAAVAERRRRGVVLTGLVALFAISLVVSRLPQPEARPSQVAPAGADTTPAAVAAAQTSGRYFDANLVLRQQDDIGHPPLGVAETRRRPRTLFGTSGRAEAWRGALEQGAERPLLGYGFGSEDDVFVDRYVHFHSDLPESSYIGLFLQLGGAGLFAFGALVAVVLARAARALRRLRGGELRIAAAAGGALVVGLILGFFQSYVYAAGNNATAAVWICAFLLTAATTVPAVRGRPVRA
jgi:O-antigen ligase